ncbi:kunitz-type protease inhibitor 2 [Osmerus mordax]|uniref:kunitz-type protease inhibitor 2 n=1 Tax=Osmerus mordax TaxID=8014 RepID=UPI00351021B0
MAQVLSGGILCLFVVFVTSQVQEGIGGCAWDTEADPEQGLEPMSYENGARNLAHLPEITDMEGCQRACCNNKDCQLAMIGRPADGMAQCYLVTCIKDGQDVCTLGPSTQFQVYRKTSERQHTPRIQVVGLSDSETRVTNSTDQCLQPMFVGRCRASHRRFYYHAANGSCKPFIYGGCNANGNNFQSQEECEKTCSGVTGPVVSKEAYPGTPEPFADSKPGAGPVQASARGRMSGPLRLEDQAVEQDVHKEGQSDYAERCQAKTEVGPCRASMRRFHYDFATQTCQPFIFGGCSGNSNNYHTEEDCMSSCTVSVSTSKKGPAVANQQYIDSCVVPYDAGPCRASFPMFYFDSVSQTCRPFTYGGCRGNSNSYSSAAECLSRCTGDQGRFELLNADVHGWWVPALFVVGTLVALTVLVLAGLIVVTALRARCQRHSSHGDKEELLTRQTSLETLAQDESPKVVGI